MIELGDAAAIADEDDGLAGFRIPAGGGAGAVGEGEALGVAAVGVGDEEFGVAEHGGRKHELRAVGRPRGRAVGAAETRERDDFSASTEYMQICGLTTPW